MNLNAQLAAAIGWADEQIETEGDLAFIRIGDERFSFSIHDPLVIEPVQQKYGVVVLQPGWAHIPGQPIRVGKDSDEAVAKAVIGSVECGS